MTEEEWNRGTETNAMFAAMERPSDARLAAFSVACCRRIRAIISDDVTRKALDALDNAADHATIPAELALASLQVCTSSEFLNRGSPRYDPRRNFYAARAVACAACRSLPPGSSHYGTDALENARLVAFYGQWAAGEAADTGPDDESCEGTENKTEPGSSWITEHAQRAEASAQCDLIRSLFARRTEFVP